MPRLLLHILFFLAITPYLSAQKVVVVGRVTDSETGKPIQRVNIAFGETSNGTSTDKNGEYKKKVRYKEDLKLHFSAVGYRSESRTLTNMKENDTITLNIEMLFIPTELDTFVFRNADVPPDTIFGSREHNLKDFEFHEDKLLLLTYDKRPGKDNSLVLSNGDSILSSAYFPNGAKSLFRDFLGYVNVITEEDAYRIVIEKDNISLQRIDKQEFETTIKPGLDTIAGKILFSDYRWYYPAFSFYSFSTGDSLITSFKTVTDEPLADLYRSEYYWLPPQQKVAARKIAIETGMTKTDVAVLMSNFHNSLYYTPLYAPLFVQDDTILIFDHYSDKLYKYNSKTEAIDSVTISYHKDKLPGKWRRQLLADSKNQRVHGLFQRNGYYYLRMIDKENGSLSDGFKLTYKYAEQIKIRDGYVYYLYRPYESLQKKFLYREHLGF